MCRLMKSLSRLRFAAANEQSLLHVASEQLEAFFGRKTHDQLQALFHFFVLAK